jgi:hypothetical protein
VTRVLIFFAAFIGAIAVPQIIAHGLNYLYPAQSGFGEDENALRATPAGFADPALVFGRSVRLDLMQDPRPIFPQVLAGAEVAQYGMTATGSSVLAARFASTDAATQARYALFRMLGKVDAQEDERGFYRFVWPQSGFSAIAGSGGRTFMMWLAPDREAVQRLRAESRAFSDRAPAPRTGLGGFVDAVRGWPVSRYFALIALYALFVSWLFLRLVTWATEVEANPVASSVNGGTLKERLLRVRFLESPITIGPGKAENQLIVDWKYADATWASNWTIRPARCAAASFTANRRGTRAPELRRSGGKRRGRSFSTNTSTSACSDCRCAPTARLRRRSRTPTRSTCAR